MVAFRSEWVDERNGKRILPEKTILSNKGHQIKEVRGFPQNNLERRAYVWDRDVQACSISCSKRVRQRRWSLPKGPPSIFAGLKRALE